MISSGRAEVGVPELALDDGQRHALAGEFERVRVTQLVRREPAPDARPDGDAAELATDGRANEVPSRTRPQLEVQGRRAGQDELMCAGRSAATRFMSAPGT